MISLRQPTWVICPNIKALNSDSASILDLNEMVSLAKALPSVKVKGSSIEPVNKINPSSLFGSGKIKEINQYIRENEIKLVLVDGILTPIQQRNLEKIWKVKVLDKTGLIIEIFSDRAQSREGVLQVELAALKYQRTRLVRAWTHLERQRGGLGFVGGPGETQIESDRRAIDIAIFRIQKNLGKIVKTRRLHRGSRKKRNKKFISLVGYTNSGKSTIFNYLTGSNVFTKDMLFATLDPTIRAFVTPDNIETLMSDTVGFISDLPAELIAAFSATLEEIKSADLILHVRDISHLDTEKQYNDVNGILELLGVSRDKKIIEVWNKVDLLPLKEQNRLLNIANRKDNVFLVSALEKAGFKELLADVSATFKIDNIVETMKISAGSWKCRNWLYQNTSVLKETFENNKMILEVEWSSSVKQKYIKKYQ